MRKGEIFPAFPKETRRALDHLKAAFERAGHGAMRATARALGLHPAFYSERWRRKRFDVGCLVATLKHLTIRPSAFFAELEGDAAGGGGLSSEPIAERSTPETRAAVKLAYRRMRGELAGVDLVPELEGGDNETTAAGGPPLDAEWLAGLDARRQDEPEAVAAELAAGLGRVEAALLPQALGVWSSALRLMLGCRGGESLDELKLAAYVNRQGLALARAAWDSATEADLLIRRSYVVADAGDHRGALALAQSAAGVYASIGDQVNRARALVDCGRWFHACNRHRESVAAHEQALELLPESLPEYHFGAVQVLGLVHLKLGDTDAAERCTELATPLATSAGRRVKLAWLRAKISRQRGRFDESESLFRHVVETFEGLHYGEAALASLELVEVLLEQGKPVEAWRVCAHVGLLQERENPIISAAMGGLIRAGVGGLRLGLVRAARQELEAMKTSATARHKWRAMAAAG